MPDLPNVLGPDLVEAAVIASRVVWVLVITNIIIMLILLVPRLWPRKEH